MGDPFGLEMAKVRQKELLREAEERRITRSLRRLRHGVKGGREEPAEPDGVEVRWGLMGDERAVADLLELNALVSCIALDKRFVVEKTDGKFLGDVGSSTKSKRWSI